MDAHVFRRFCDALEELLAGARLEKIQSPAVDVHIFTFYAQQRKHILVMRHDRRNPLLFIAPERYSTGQHPPAATMRLRKYAAGRRVKACVSEWGARRLHLCFHGAPQAHEHPNDLVQPETWITLDMRQGPLLTLGSSPDFGEAPVWPAACEAVLACLPPASAAVPAASVPEHSLISTDPPEKVWHQWPVLTPALRRTLPLLESSEQAALLADLAYGGGDIFVYTSAGGATTSDATPVELSAWPLPPPLRGQRAERVCEDPFEALALAGAQQVMGGLARAGQKAASSPHTREAKRLTRVLDKLEHEEARLKGMVAGKERALYLQSVLWFFPPDARPGALARALTDDAVGNMALPPCPFAVSLLQETLSLRENMETLFHGAARGSRGLAMLEQRRALLRGQVTVAREEAVLSASLGMVAPPVRKEPAGKDSASKARSDSPRLMPKNVESFTSVDGLLILRGKDARGNLAMLKLGAPADLWLHVAGGPGAHTLVRRSFVGQDIPQSTLEQAATLAAVKSWQKGNEKVEVQCAQVRHVKPMRGAGTGTVRIDKIECMVRVTLPLP